MKEPMRYSDLKPGQAFKFKDQVFIKSKDSFEPPTANNPEVILISKQISDLVEGDCFAFRHDLTKTWKVTEVTPKRIWCIRMLENYNFEYLPVVKHDLSPIEMR